MPTLPLYDTHVSSPDASHHVTAPGGYESWHFDATDTTTDTQLIATFSIGDPFHPRYLRRYFHYRRRPTHISPPLPQEYSCVHFALYRNARLIEQLNARYAPELCQTQATGEKLCIGTNTLSRELDGKWTLSVNGTLSAELTFSPRLPHAPHERPFVSPHHRQLIADPLCDVSGVITPRGSSTAKIQFTGRGYHEHQYGTAPFSLDIQRWLRGRVLLDRRALTFHMARALGPSIPDEMRLIESDETGMRDLPLSRVVADWSARAGLRLAYPNGIAFGDLLRLQTPRVIDSSRFRLRLTYEAVLRGEKGTALCEVIYPQRFRLPVVARMMELFSGPTVLVPSPGTPGEG